MNGLIGRWGSATLFVVLTAATSLSFAATSKKIAINQTKCTYLTDNKPFGYCVTKTLGSTNPDILYYMHGAGLSQRAWIKSRKPIWKYWNANGIQAPTVVTVSFGPIWLLAQKNKSSASGLLEFVAETYIPQIEKALGGLHGRRLILGESMGGFNTAQLILKRPQLFSKGTILCPDVTTLLPYSSKTEMEAWMKSTGTDFWHAGWETIMQRIFFADNNSWNQASVLSIGKKDLNEHTPPLYISCGRQDEYGFFPGAEQFAADAQVNGVSVIWEPLEGKHCVYNAAAVAKFLTQ